MLLDQFLDASIALSITVRLDVSCNDSFRCDPVFRIERTTGSSGSDDVIGFPLLNVCNQS